MATFYGREVDGGANHKTPRADAWSMALPYQIGHVRKEEIQMEILEEQQALGLGTAGAGILDKNISPWGNAI